MHLRSLLAGMEQNSFRLYFLGGLLFTFLTLFIACEKIEPYSGSDIKLRISQDTLRFDTVFTTVGSATRSIKIYNDLSTPVSIPEITLSDNGNFFRMNVDGESGSTVNNIVIQAEDSIYVFIEVTINPDNPLTFSPFIINEKLLINSGGEIVALTLEAWGQNANYFPSKASKRKVNLLTCDLGTIIWDDPKPYVIYGVLAIDSCKLEIPAGTQLYVHGGIVKNDASIYNDGLLIFLKDGSLSANGTLSEPIVFQGDRLEPEFTDVPGQWAGIRFFNESKNNTIQHTEIKNAIVGLRVDSTAELTIESSKIHHTAGSGIIGVNGNIKANNCLLHNNAGSGFQLVYGGNYELNYCTVANYNNQSEAITLTNYICTDPLCLEEILVSPLNAVITNCIFDGNSDKEVLIDDISSGNEPSLFSVLLNNIQLRHDEPENIPSLLSCSSCFYHNLDDDLFFDINEDNYSLDTMSVAIGKGIQIDNIFDDILENVRDQNNPDLGCYEFQ